MDGASKEAAQNKTGISKTEAVKNKQSVL